MSNVRLTEEREVTDVLATGTSVDVKSVKNYNTWSFHGT